MVKVLIVIPVYKRPEVLQLCLIGLKKLREMVKSWVIAPVFILSPEDEHMKTNEKLVKSAGFKVVYFKNLPVSDKLNAGIRYCWEHYDFDYLMNLGSDDLIHPQIEQLYAPYLEKNVHFFGINTLYFWDFNNEKVIYFDTYNTNGSIGAARMIHKSIIDWFMVNEFPLYEPGINSGMDCNSAMNIKRNMGEVDVIVESGKFPYVVDVKTDTNINHMMYIEARERNITPSDLSFIKQHYTWL